mgnify:CR=1 FL=1
MRRKYYKFPRSYYNRNKVRKPFKVKDLIRFILLFILFYAVVSTFFIGTYRAKGQTVVAVRTYLSKPHVGDTVLYSPEYYCRAPKWLAPFDIFGRVMTFQCFSVSKALGFDTGYLEKRVAGVPGDTVKIDRGDVGTFVLLRDVPEVRLEEGFYYLLDDDRNYLSDSRSSGPVDKRRIHAKVICRFKGLGK